MGVMEERVDPASQDAAVSASDSPYAPPQSVVAEPVVTKLGPAHYVVGARKFFLLYWVTFGLYGIYWFYAHWARIRTVRRLSILPAARTVFSVFYTHSLARELDQSLRQSRRAYNWSPTVVATAFVVLQLVSVVLERLSWSAEEFGALDALGIALLLPMAGVSWSLQHVANLASGDPDGDGNRCLTWANWLWLVGGGLFWLLVVLVFALPAE